MMSWWRNGNQARRHDDISASEVARTLELHMRECREEKAEIKRRLDEHHADSDRRHEENIARFSRIDRTIYIATGAAMVIVWVASHAGEVIEKLLK